MKRIKDSRLKNEFSFDFNIPFSLIVSIYTVTFTHLHVTRRVITCNGEYQFRHFCFQFDKLYYLFTQNSLIINNKQNSPTNNICLRKIKNYVLFTCNYASRYM